MRKTIRLTESDLMRLVKRVINEQTPPPGILTQTGPPSNQGGDKNKNIANINYLKNMIKKEFDTSYRENFTVQQLCSNIQSVCSELSKKLK